MICLVFLLFACFLLDSSVVNGLVVTGVNFLSSSGKNDYVLVGEPFTMSCLYMVENENERPSSVEILKEDQQVYLYDMASKKRSTRGIFANNIDQLKSGASFVIIRNATIEMHGNYTCKVKSEISCSELAAPLTIINDACKESDWTMRSDMIHCLEVIDLECIGMFPKPIPSCGVFEQNSGRFISIQPFHMIAQLPNKTYLLYMSHRYSAEEYRKKQGEFLFKCIFRVVGTSWSRTINSRLFARPGCPSPPEIENGKYEISPVKTCWNTPVEGSLVSFKCDTNYTLSKQGSLICYEGRWRRFSDEISSPRSINFNTMQFLPSEQDPFPYCNIASYSSLSVLLMQAILILHVRYFLGLFS